MEVLLVDTGPLVAMANKRDKFHRSCSEYLKSYRGRLLTTWAVLTEFAHLTDCQAIDAQQIASRYRPASEDRVKRVGRRVLPYSACRGEEKRRLKGPFEKPIP